LYEKKAWTCFGALTNCKKISRSPTTKYSQLMLRCLICQPSKSERINAVRPTLQRGLSGDGDSLSHCWPPICWLRLFAYQSCMWSLKPSCSFLGRGSPIVYYIPRVEVCAGDNVLMKAKKPDWIKTMRPS
jgi:hypothetical protein